MDSSELATAVNSIMSENTVKSIFDPVEPLPVSPRPPLAPSPLHFGSKTQDLRDESSDEETRLFILKNDGFVPKSSASNGTPRVKLIRKTPRIKNAPTCTHLFKRGARKGDICGNYCKLGDKFCSKHNVSEKKPPVHTLNYETIAVKSRFERLKISKKYKLLQYVERTVILENGGRILKVVTRRDLRSVAEALTAIQCDCRAKTVKIALAYDLEINPTPLEDDLSFKANVLKDLRRLVGLGHRVTVTITIE